MKLLGLGFWGGWGPSRSREISLSESNVWGEIVSSLIAFAMIDWLIDNYPSKPVRELRRHYIEYFFVLMKQDQLLFSTNSNYPIYYWVNKYVKF